MNKYNNKLTALYMCLFLAFALVFIPITLSKANSDKETLPVRVAYLRDKSSRFDIDTVRAPLDILLSRYSENYESDYDYNFKSEASVYDDVESIIEDVRKNKLDAVTLISSDYLVYEKEDLLVPTLMILQGDQPLDKYVFLVHKDSGINNIADLKDKDLITEKGARNIIATLWLNTLLLKKGLDEADSYFRLHKKVEKTSQAVLPVFFGQADVCVTTEDAFNTMSELNPQLKNELKVLLRSPGFACYLVCFNKQFPKDKRDIITKGLSEVNKSPEGQQIFMIAQLTDIIRFKEEYLDTIRELYKEYQNLKKSKIENKE